MELASTVAEGDSDLAAAFMEAGRMRELVEAFAACSKALAVSPQPTCSKPGTSRHHARILANAMRWGGAAFTF